MSADVQSLTVASSILHAVTSLSVARAFASEIFASGGLPLITSYIPSTLPKSPLPVRVGTIVNAISAVRNLACANRSVRAAVTAGGTCGAVLSLLRECVDGLSSGPSSSSSSSREKLEPSEIVALNEVACASLGALRNLCHSSPDAISLLVSLSAPSLLQKILSSPSLFSSRETTFRACGTLVNITELSEKAAAQFTAADLPSLEGFRAASGLTVGRLDTCFKEGAKKKNTKPLHKGYLSLLSAVTAAVFPPDSAGNSGENEQQLQAFPASSAIDPELLAFVSRANEAKRGDEAFREKRSKEARNKLREERKRTEKEKEKEKEQSKEEVSDERKEGGGG